MANVFNRTGFDAAAAQVADPAQLITPANLQGKTPQFDVYLDPALGAACCATDGPLAPRASVVSGRKQLDYPSLTRNVHERQ